MLRGGLSQWQFLSDKVLQQSCSGLICLNGFHLERAQFLSSADLFVKPTFSWMWLARERIVFRFSCSKSDIWFATWNSSPFWKLFYLWCRWIIYSWKCKGPGSVLEYVQAASILCREGSWGQDLAMELREWGSEQCWENRGLLKSSCFNSVTVFQL